MSELRPVAANERVAVLDVLRGFALFGVLLANAAWFTTRFLSRAPQKDIASIDVIAREWMRFFVDGKAMTTLTILFGLGFGITLLRAEQRGVDGARLFARRLAALFVIGWCHIAVLWLGDITWIYAVSGFALLAFRRTSDRKLLVWAAVLIFGTALLMPFVIRLLGVSRPGNGASAELVAAIHGTDYLELAWQQIRYVVTTLPMTAWFFIAVVGRFLLGYYAARRRFFDGDGAEHLALFRRVLWWGLALGVTSGAVGVVRTHFFADYEVLPPGMIALRFNAEIQQLAMAAAYISIVVLLLQRPPWRRVLMIVAPIGRMPLTVYLSQSLFAAAVYYGWGLGLAKSAGIAATVGISCAIFAAQLGIAHLWLRTYRFGPAEWLWRTLVYGRAQPMRLSPPVLPQL